MKKVFGAIAKIAFTLFTLGVFGMLMSYTFSALGRLFPGDPINQLWGMMLFDIAAIVWGLAFVFESRSLAQYALAAVGFLTAFVGTIGMVAAEVLLSGGQFADTASEIAKWMTYGFILVTVLHVALLYAHHAAAPEVDEQIRVGVARGEIVSHAITEAEKGLDAQKAQLAASITADIVARVQRDLSLLATRPHVLDLPALPVDDTLHADSIGWPAPAKIGEREAGQTFFGRMKARWQKPEPKAAETSLVKLQEQGDSVVWTQTPEGARRRVFCLVCKAEGKPWMTPEPCEHVLKATGQPVTLEAAKPATVPEVLTDLEPPAQPKP